MERKALVADRIGPETNHLTELAGGETGASESGSPRRAMRYYANKDSDGVTTLTHSNPMKQEIPGVLE